MSKKSRGSRRSKKLINPRIQLRFILVTLLVAGLMVLLQAILLGYHLNELVVSLPNDGALVLESVPSILLTSLMLSVGLVVPVGVLLSVLYSFRVVGPIYRFQQYLREVADGKQPGPCRIRKKDELQEMCDLINEVTLPLRYDLDEGRGRRSAAQNQDEELVRQ